MLLPEIHTIEDMMHYGMSLYETSEVFLGHGTDFSGDEVFAIVMYVLGLPMNSDDSVLDRILLEKEKQAICVLLQRRINERIPVCYLIFEAFFAGLSFYVDERVIIPRSPLAECIEQGFSPWIREENVKTILDMCTGSGCIAIACAYAFPDAEIDAVDISPEALEVAKINVEKHNKASRVKLILSDLFTEINDKKYDVIISNPPYVSPDEMATLPAEFLHEPDNALRAEDEGLALVLAIMRSAREALTEHGVLFLEVGNSKEALVARYPHLPFVWLEFERGGDGVFVIEKSQLDSL